MTINLSSVSRAQRSTSRAFTPVFAGYGGALQTTDLGFTRDRRLKCAQVGQARLARPLRSVAVPDQRRHSASKTRVNALMAPLCFALHCIRETQRKVRRFAGYRRGSRWRASAITRGTASSFAGAIT